MGGGEFEEAQGASCTSVLGDSRRSQSLLEVEKVGEKERHTAA